MLAFLVHRYYFCCQSFAKDRSLQLRTSALTLIGVSVHDICPCSLTCLEVTIIETGTLISQQELLGLSFVSQGGSHCANGFVWKPWSVPGKQAAVSPTLTLFCSCSPQGVPGGVGSPGRDGSPGQRVRTCEILVVARQISCLVTWLQTLSQGLCISFRPSTFCLFCVYFPSATSSMSISFIKLIPIDSVPF